MLNCRYQTRILLPIMAIILFALLALLPSGSLAQEVKAKYKNLVVNANLELAEGKRLEDGVILIAHALIQHDRMEIIRSLQALFKQRGYSSIAINYSLNVNDRHGMFNCMTPHRHIRQATLEELGFWVGWLKARGVKQVVMAGHSTGANEVATYAGLYHDPAITHVILIAPSTSDHSSNTPAGYRLRFKKDVNKVLARAQKLVDAGHGDAIMEHTDFLYCPGAPVSAATFVSYYGGRSSVRLLPAQLDSLTVPALVIAAGEDNQAPDTAAIIKPHADGKHIHLVTIDGASHFLRDLFLEDAVDAMVAFLQK
jgi:pimeloyl-ACP methyl ester carboxylesterase